MCVTFLCTDGPERGLPLKLVLLNNRDELLDRPTAAAAWCDGFLAGWWRSALFKDGDIISGGSLLVVLHCNSVPRLSCFVANMIFDDRGSAICLVEGCGSRPGTT